LLALVFKACNTSFKTKKELNDRRKKGEIKAYQIVRDDLIVEDLNQEGKMDKIK